MVIFSQRQSGIWVLLIGGVLYPIPKGNLFKDWCNARINALFDIYQSTEKIERPVVKGAIRENLVKDLVVDLLPKPFETATGSAFSLFDLDLPEVPTQRDIIVYDPSIMLFPFRSQNTSIVPAEIVVGVV